MTQKRSLTKLDYFALTFGMIIGIGWITVLGFWLSDAGPLGAAVAFVAGILFLAPVGICYAEMAGIYPQVGGPIVYALREIGVKTSFIAGWMLALTMFLTIIFEALSIGWLMETLWPASMGPLLYSFKGSNIHVGHLVFGIGLNWMLCYTNLKGGSTSAVTQRFLTGVLLVIVAVLIGAAIFQGSNKNLIPLFVESANGSVWPGIIAVFVGVPFYLTGFESIAQGISERDKNVSARAIANIIILSIACAALFYVAIIFSAAAVAPRVELIGSDLATAKAFEIGLGSTALMKAALIGGLLGLLSTWNACIFVFVRAMLALGRNHMIWPGFAKVNKNGISIYAIAFAAVVVALGVLLGKNAIIPLVNSSSTAVGMLFFIVCLSMVRSRKNKPHMSRPYRAPGGLLLPILGCISSLYIMVLTIIDPYTPGEPLPLEWWLFGGWAVFGVILWFVGSSARRKENFDLNKMIELTESEASEIAQ